MAKKQIRLNEENLRNFISYSVARLLKEGGGFNGFAGRPIYDSYGEYDGSEWSKYGSSDVEVPFYEWANSQNDILDVLFDSANEKHGGQFTEILKSENDSLDLLSTIYGNLGDEDITLYVDFTYSKGMKGDGYMQPDDPDELTINKSYLKQPETNQALQKMDPTYREFMTAVASEWANGWVDEDYIYNNYVEDTIMEEKNLGITTHFDGNSSFQPKNPYEDMTWDEYCAAKRKEHEEDDNKPEEGPDRTNRGIMTHFDGKKREETPEDKERAEHMFDDDYWVDKMNLSKDELNEIVRRTVKRLTEEMNLGGEGEEVADNFPKKAAGTFTMNTRRGNTDKYKVYVEKTDNGELLTDIFIYDPMDKEWYPQAEYVVGIEEYTNGTWLPYWETFNGDVSIRALANCFNKVVKLWKKVGYLFDEDDEIPFRYAGDIKGLNGKMF